MFFGHGLCIVILIFAITTLILEFNQRLKANKIRAICFIQIANILMLLWLLIASVVFVFATEMNHTQLFKVKINTISFYDKEGDLETNRYVFYVNPYNGNLENFAVEYSYYRDITYVSIPKRTFGGISFFHPKDLNDMIKKKMGIK